MSHAILSPSGADGWALCPGKPAMEEGLRDESNEYADEGTALHFVYYVCNQVGRNAIDHEGKTVCVAVEGQDDGTAFMEDCGGASCRRSFVMTPDRIKDVQTALDNTRALVAAIPDLVRAGYEEKLPVGLITGEEGAEGTADAVFVGEGEIQIHDLKMGRKPAAADCRQLKLYALAAVRKYDMLYGPFDRIKLVIHKPRLDSQPIVADLTAEELDAFGEEIKARAYQAMTFWTSRKDWVGTPEESAHLVPSEDACRYCRAGGSCKTRAEAILSIFDNAKAVTAAGGLTPEQRSAWLKQIPAIQDWCEAVEKEAYSLALKGERIPDFKLVEGREGNRAWADEAEAEKTLSAMRLKVDEMYDKKLKSPTAIDKLLGPKGSDPAPRKWKKVEVLITRAPAKLSLVPITDKRPEKIVEKVTAESFEDLSAVTAPAQTSEVPKRASFEDMI